MYGGLFFTTLSTLMYEVLLTRIFSVTMWYHFAFVAVSVALFGMTVGALLVYLWPRLFPDDQTHQRIYQASLLFALTLVASFIIHLQIEFDPKWSVGSVLSIALTYLVISVPFIFSGITVCLALTRFPKQISRLYAVDLIGAALGTITLIWLLDMLRDGPSAVLAVAAFAAAGGALFAYAPGLWRSTLLAAVVGLVLLGLGIGNSIAAQNRDPVLRVSQAKGLDEDVPLFETWNAFSRVRVNGDTNIVDRPFVFGLSPSYPGGETVRTLGMTIDAAAGTVLTSFEGPPQDVEYLRYDVVQMAHYLRPDARIAIIGTGGGRDILAALSFEQRSITAIEMNGAILDAVNDRYGDFTRHLNEEPGVEVVNDEARSFLARTDDRFDIIQIPFIDTWAATAAGAFALSENGLYTEEAWQTFYDRLAEGGILSVSRWYYLPQPVEAYRLTALGAESLRGIDIDEPRDHMIFIRSVPSFENIAVGTILISPQPFSAADVAEIERVADDLEFELLLAPGYAGDPLFEEIAETDDLGSVDLGFPADISAPTDDRPFFFQMIGFTDLFDSSLYGGFNDNLAQPVLVLFSLSIAVLVLTVLCILLPLALRTSRSALQGMGPFVVFFASIGLGFLLLEISQMQRLIIFLGHPTFALSVVLFSLLLFSGIGSLATERLVNPASNPGLSPRLLWPLVVLLIVVVTFGFATPGVIDQFEAGTTPVRILAAVGVLAPMGLVLGMPFPLGMKVASLRPNAPTAFFWGINGATSVAASVLAVAVSMGWGISNAFWAGCLAYVVATVALGVVVVRGRV